MIKLELSCETIVDILHIPKSLYFKRELIQIIDYDPVKIVSKSECKRSFMYGSSIHPNR
jgi:hypothetical protein